MVKVKKDDDLKAKIQMLKSNTSFHGYTIIIMNNSKTSINIRIYVLIDLKLKSISENKRSVNRCQGLYSPSYSQGRNLSQTRNLPQTRNSGFDWLLDNIDRSLSQLLSVRIVR